MRQLIFFIYMSFFISFAAAQTKSLNYFIENAINNSPLLYKTINNEKINRLDLQKIKTRLSKPYISFETNILFAPVISHDNSSNKFEWISNGADNYFGYDLGLSDGGQYETYISLKQPVFTHLIYKNYAQKSAAYSQKNKNIITLTQHELKQLVNHQYLLCLQSKKQAELTSSLINEMQENLKLMKTLVENAVFKQSDLILLNIEIQNYKLRQKTYRAEFENNMSDLKLICGINEKIPDITDTYFTILPDTIPKSQFLNTFKSDSLIISAEQKIFEQKYKPQIYVFADAGMKSTYTPSYNRFGFSTGLSLSWNIFDGNQKKKEAEKTIIKQQTVSFKKQNFINKNNIYKQKYLTQISSLNERITITKQQIHEYNNLYELYKQELRNAQISVMDLKNLTKDIFNKRQEYLTLKFKKQIIINNYNFHNF